jgi:UDP-N-acetylmuramoyl-tripeptide--D-alanyl-D-alanine ligase
VLNADDPAVAAMATRTRARVVTVGRSPEATVRAEDLTLAAGRPRFRLVAPQGSAEVALRLVGAHHVGNALSATAVALECGATPEGVAAALSAAGPASRWRMEVVDRADGVTVVNDAYNANPESMRAALQALAALGGNTRRTWAVLGRIAELGDASAAAHAEVAATAAELGVDHLVTVGPTEYGRGRPVADVGAALDLLRAELKPGDVVLVKASRAVGLDRLADALVQEREPVA